MIKALKYDVWNKNEKIEAYELATKKMVKFRKKA